VALTDAPLVDPVGLVVPPAESKRVIVADPLPDGVIVVLVVGMKTASKEQAAEITIGYGFIAEPTAPLAAA